MSEPFPSFKEGHICEGPFSISGLWIYLGLFNYLEADFIGNNLYKCEIKKNKPWFMDYEQHMAPGTPLINRLKIIGCTLEDINTLVESSKEKFRDLYSIHSNRHFEFVVSNYIRIMTLSKGDIKIPNNFKIVSSDNDSLILRASNL
jgi:hypothetical protein